MPTKIVAILTPKPGCDMAVEAAAILVVAGSRTEPGCLRYDLWREPGGAQRYVIDELYADQAAVDAHRLTPHYKAFRTAIADLLDLPPATSQVDAVDVIA